MKILGIDEAGRGPVIGPMVLAGVLIKESDEIKLTNMGVKDSKQLSKNHRELLFEKIINNYENKIIIVQANEIDDSLNSKTSNLNWLEADTTIKIIESLKPNKAILDAPSSNINKYIEYITTNLKTKTNLVAEHKADEKFPIVGAASILAKVTRDREIEKLKNKYNVNFGSGYPSDPLTKKFLKENYNKFDFFRKTWASYKKVSQKPLSDF